jgi:hypothetical protein
MARGALLWLLGVPIPIIILLLLFWRWLYQSELSLQQLRDDGRWPSSQDQTTTSPRDLSVVCRDNFKNVTRR